MFVLPNDEEMRSKLIFTPVSSCHVLSTPARLDYLIKFEITRINPPNDNIPTDSAFDFVHRGAIWRVLLMNNFRWLTWIDTQRCTSSRSIHPVMFSCPKISSGPQKLPFPANHLTPLLQWRRRRQHDQLIRRLIFLHL